MSIRITSATFVHDHLNEPVQLPRDIVCCLWLHRSQNGLPPPKFLSSESLISSTIFAKKKKKGSIPKRQNSLSCFANCENSKETTSYLWGHPLQIFWSAKLPPRMFEKSGSPLNAFKPSSRLSTKLLKNSNASCCSRKFTGSPHSLGETVQVITSCKPWAIPVLVVRNLVSWFYSQLSMSSDISELCSVAFYHLYNIWPIGKHLSQEAAGTLVHTLIIATTNYMSCQTVSLRKFREFSMLLLGWYVMRLGFVILHQ